MFTKMTKLPADPIVISLLSTTLTVLGCGVTPAGQEANVMRENCIIVGNTVTRICTVPMPLPLNNNMMCDTYVAVIPPRHLTIGELISTTNIIMANWSRTMWQSVVSRAVRVLASGPFGLNFASASAVVSGN